MKAKCPIHFFFQKQEVLENLKSRQKELRQYYDV